MPTYEYRCEKCNHKFELFQSMTESPLTQCPREKCAQKRWGKGRVKRVIGGGAGLIFKGSGFYITDYRSDSYKEAAKKDTSGDTPTKGGESKAKETKSETKPSKTPEPSKPKKADSSSK